MSEANLKAQVDRFFRTALAQIKTYPALRSLQREMERACQKLDEPMRVAIVGNIKAGKSTLLNALLGESLVAMGRTEATFNVNWLKYGPKASLVVHYKDKRPPEPKTLEELTTLTLRAEENKEVLLSIEFIEVFYPNPILKVINLIDTPGLLSSHQDDSDNAKRFLRVYGEELTKTTLSYTQPDNADAVLFLFSRSLTESGQKFMEEFQGPALARATPINAVGVFNRVDAYWDKLSTPDPIAAVKKVIDGLTTRHPQINRTFYTIVPACGLLALGAKTLTEQEFVTLKQLATLPEVTLNRLLGDATRFCQKDFPTQPEIPSTSNRTAVLHRLDRYGIDLACQYFRSGVKDKEELGQLLFQQSGVSNLLHLIQNHFGDRAFLIKFNTCLQRLKKLLFQEQKRQTGAAQTLVCTIAGWLDELEIEIVQDSQELEVLQMLYQGNKLDSLTEEEMEQLLCAIGERGKSCPACLRLPKDASMTQMQQQANQLLLSWQYILHDMARSTETIRAATLLVNIYEKLLYLLSRVQQELDISEDRSGDRTALAEALRSCTDFPDLSTFYHSIPAKLDNLQAWEQFQAVIHQIRQICFREQRRCQGTALEQVKAISDRLEILEANEQGLRELKVWQSYKSGKLDFEPEEVEQLEQVTGLKGNSCASQLGLDEDASLTVISDRVEKRRLYWLYRSSDSLGCDTQTLWAAQVLCQSYESMQYRVDRAKMLLGLAD